MNLQKVLPMYPEQSVTYVPVRSELSEGNPTRRKMQIVEPSRIAYSKTKANVVVETEGAADLPAYVINLPDHLDDVQFCPPRTIRAGKSSPGTATKIQLRPSTKVYPPPYNKRKWFAPIHYRIVFFQ